MTETNPEIDPRAWVLYSPDQEDAGEVSLPGVLDARPSIVSPGDRFSIDRDFLDELTAGGQSERFVAIVDPAELEELTQSPNAGLPLEELAEKIGEKRLQELEETARRRGVEVTPDDLVTLADEHDRMHPQPVGDGDPTLLPVEEPEPVVQRPATPPSVPPAPAVAVTPARDAAHDGDGNLEGSNR